MKQKVSQDVTVTRNGRASDQALRDVFGGTMNPVKYAYTKKPELLPRKDKVRVISGHRDGIPVEQNPASKKRKLQKNPATLEAFPKEINADDLLDIVRGIHHNQEDFEDGDLAERIEKNWLYELKTVKTEKLEVNYDIDDYIVDNMIKKHRKSLIDGTYPPIVVNRRIDDIIDGNHRFEALTRLGVETVLCYVPKRIPRKTTATVQKNPFQWSIVSGIPGNEATRPGRRVSAPQLTEIEAKGFVAWIKPETFLKLAHDIRGSERNLKFLEEKWDENSPIAIPFLMLVGRKNGRGRSKYYVSGHEGRHRCMVSRNNGLKLVPVAFFIYDYDEGQVIGPDLTSDVVDDILNKSIQNQDQDKMVHLKSDIFWLDGEIYVDGIMQHEITIEECLRLGSKPTGVL